MKKNVPLLLLACYFLPFCLFFAVTIFTSKILAFCTALLVVSLATLILFLAIKQSLFEAAASVIPSVIPSVIQSPPKEEAPRIKLQSLIQSIGSKEVSIPHIPRNISYPEKEQQNALQEKITSQEQELLLLKQKVELSTAAIDELKTELKKKDEEIENLKFELRVLVRLDEKILSASILDNKVPDTAQKP